MPNPMQNITTSITQGADSATGVYAALGQAAQSYSNTAVAALNAVLKAQEAGTKASQGSAAATKKSETEKLTAVLLALKSKALLKTVEATAQGFQYLADLNFVSAAEDFAAAALWGTIAGSQIASAASGGGGGSAAAARNRANKNAYQGGGGRGGSEDQSVGSGSSALSAGAMSAAQPPTGNLTVSIMGDNEAGQWLAKTLTTAVEAHGAQLTASSAKRSPYA